MLALELEGSVAALMFSVVQAAEHILELRSFFFISMFAIRIVKHFLKHFHCQF